jgi:uncharacterized protein with HEPN domain
MRDKIGEKIRLLHIRDAINYIKEFSSGKDLSDFSSEPMMRFAVERQLEIIGEAANHLSEEAKNKAPQIDWRNIKAFRNIAAHEYFGISETFLHQIVIHDIPELESAILALIDEYN